MDARASIVLKKGEDKRLKSGHLWIFSNEIREMPDGIANGALVEVRSAGGDSLGFGFFNRNSLISVRLLSKLCPDSLRNLLSQRMHEADAKRKLFGYGETYRMVFGESDGLPGLVIDRYGADFVVESFSAGIDTVMEDVVTVLVEEFHAARVAEKSDSQWRSYEGLENNVRMLHGEPGAAAVTIGDISFNINILESQKTGLFLDQRENWAIAGKLSQGRSVLDCFCSDGGFGLHAAKGGALHVVGVDISAASVERARLNAVRNDLRNAEFVEADVFEHLQTVAQDAYDMIVLDPPAFVKSKHKIASGLKGYQRMHERALRVLRDGGILVTCSCSQHVNEELFLDMLRRSARAASVTLQIIRISGAGMDHPVAAAMPETRYLTCVVCFVTRR